MAKNWMKKATSKNEGAFSRQAKAASMSTKALASKATKKGSKASATTQRRANLAKTLAKIRPGK